MTEPLLTAEERRRFRAWLMHEAQRDRAIAERMDNTHDGNPHATQTAERIRFDAFACELVLKKLDRALIIKLPKPPSPGITTDVGHLPTPS